MSDHEEWHLTDLSFRHMSEVNRERCKRSHQAELEPWTGADWSNAMCGEAGEAANVVKKLRRLETFPKGTLASDGTWNELLNALGEELADTVLYLDLVAHHYGIDLPFAIVQKFNRKSEEQGFPESLSLSLPPLLAAPPDPEEPSE